MSTYKDSLLDTIRKLCTQLDNKFAKSSDMKNYVKRADLYPVGSIIMSTTSINPASLYGGTWVSGAYISQYGGQIIFSEGATPIDGAPYVYKRIK